MYIDSSACVKVKRGESDWFQIDSGVTHGCIMSHWLFNVYMDALMETMKMGMGRRRVRFLRGGREWRLSGLLYADDLILCRKSEENLRAMAGWFAEVCRRRGLGANAGKSKVMVLNGEERLECESHVDEMCLEHLRIYIFRVCFG